MPPLPVIEKDGVLVIAFEEGSSLNEAPSAGIRQGIYAVLQAEPERRAVVDLSKIDYISSTGIAFLIGIKRRVEGGGGRLVLVGLQADVLELFGVMKLVNLFEITTTQAEALELLGPPPTN